jgi:hypothetical protein
MEARYIPAHRSCDRTPRRYPWPAFAAAVVIVAVILLLLVCRSA